MEKEIWKDIEGYEGLYQVSNLGRVRSLDRIVIHKRNRERFLKGKILKPCKDCHGYRKVCLRKDGKSRPFFIHRLVAAAFLPNPNNYSVVNHLDGNKSFNYYKNLEFTTQSGNIRHAYEHGLIKKGAESPLSKLSNEEADEIRKSYFTEKFTIRALTEKYKVSLDTIWNILHNITYVDENYTPPKVNLKLKLTFKQAEEIRKSYFTEKFTVRALTEKYKVSLDTIWNILHNITYVDENYTPPKVNLKLKLTFEQAEEIRKLYSTGNFSQHALAEKYGVSRVTISNIINYKFYKPE